MVFDFRRRVEKAPKLPVLDHDVASCQDGIKFFEGNGVEKDQYFGLYLLKEAAALKNSAAQLYLATILLEGREIPPNIKYGLNYLRDAVANENADAQFLLGQLYLRGDYVERNEKEGARLIDLSAKQGNATALLWLADLQAKGVGVQQDMAASTKSLQQAAEHGNPIADLILAVEHLQGRAAPHCATVAGQHFVAAVLKASEVIVGLDIPPRKREALLQVLSAAP